MAGRPRIVRCITSYVNHIDNHTASGPMKIGTAPSVGTTHNFWHNYQTQCNTQANKPKKSYKNIRNPQFTRIVPRLMKPIVGSTMNQTIESINKLNVY